ncbi:hypothetical protein PoB_004577300 [Plakobranchus ocellatus]|uniref:Uncharacterized protein n=1 Tax=Plakobranchus ocellatus TaxID=259542 RepID=A0AAV4BI32_9GAST|nr:hypothetical protein PoB_004577300 [Plakobranchus ocellatus]
MLGDELYSSLIKCRAATGNITQLAFNIMLEWATVGEGHEVDLDFLLMFLYDEIQRRKRPQTLRSGSGGAINNTRRYGTYGEARVTRGEVKVLKKTIGESNSAAIRWASN